MKIRHTIMAGCLLMLGLASCEMKDEILGNKTGSDATGMVNLSVTVDAKGNSIQTKAGESGSGTEDGGEVTVPEVSAKGYAVEISNSEGLYKTVTYDPTNNALVELPLGDYQIYAHAPGDPKETEAYYGGNATLKVTAENDDKKPASAAVTCKMLNTKIVVSYDTEMQTSFKKWEVTVSADVENADNKKNKILSYDGTNFAAQPDPFFWILKKGTKEIRVTFVGTNSEGKVVRENRVITKPAAADEQSWVGGDMLQINMKPQASTPENPNGVLGIEISAEVKWNGVNDTVDVPVVDDGGKEPTDPDKPTDPDQPEAGAPTITGDCIGKELTGTAENVPTIAITMDVPGKIKDVLVQINTTNEKFDGILSAEILGLTKEGGSSLLTNDFLKQMELFPLPEAGATTYDFSFSKKLFGMLASFVGTHEFILIVEDQDGKTAKASFKVTIKEAEAEGGQQ